MKTLRLMWETIESLKQFGESKGYEVDTESDTDSMVSVYFSNDTDDEAISLFINEGTTTGTVMGNTKDGLRQRQFKTFVECSRIVKGIMAIQFIESLTPAEMEEIVG